MDKRTKKWLNAIDEEFGITNRQVRQLQNELDNADFTEKKCTNPIINKLGRRVLNYKRKGQ